MMKIIFKNGEESTAERLSVANRLHRLWNNMKGKWATMMGNLCSNFTRRMWKTALVMFVSSSSILSFWNIAKTFIEDKPKQIPMAHIKHLLPTENRSELSAGETIQLTRIKKFQIYLDSLSNSSTGKVKYDSIVKARPGLIDSLKAVQIFNKSKLLKDENNNN